MKSRTLSTFIFLSALYTFALSFTKTTFVLFLYGKDFTRLETNFIFSVFNISVIIFEPLTAPIAEIFGKKKSFIIGCILKFFTAILFIYAEKMPLFVIAEILSGLSAAFISGTLTAWAVDKLKKENEWKNGYEIFAKVSRYQSLFLISGGLLGAYMGNVDLTIPWMANCFTFGVLALVSFFIMDFRKSKSIGINLTKNSAENSNFDMFTTIFQGYKQSIKDKMILAILFSSFISSFSLSSLQMFRLPIIKESFGFSQITLGYVWVFIETARLLGSFLVGKYFRIFSIPVEGLIFLPVISAVLLIGSYLNNGNILMIICFFLFEFLGPFYTSIRNEILSNRIGDVGRVTLLSIENIVDKIGTSLGLIIIGYLADLISISYAWYFSSAVFSVTSLLYYIVYIKETKGSVKNPVYG